jgi:hypothetical protein
VIHRVPESRRGCFRQDPRCSPASAGGRVPPEADDRLMQELDHFSDKGNARLT